MNILENTQIDNKHKIWSKDEDSFLIKNYLTLGKEKCCDILKRTNYSVISRAKFLKANQPIKKWTEFEIDFLIKNYPHHALNYCSEKLNISKNIVEAKVNKLKLKISSECRARMVSARYILTEDQRQFIIDNYRKFGGKYCSDELKVKYGLVNGFARRMGLNRECLPKKRIKTKLNSEIIDNIDKNFAYFLGYMWADGYLVKQNNDIRLGIEEKDAFNIIPSMVILGKWAMYRVQDKKHKSMKRIPNPKIIFSASNKIIHKFLAENDYYEKSINDPYKILSKIPENMRHYWWRGYFDGDGCISQKIDERCVCKTFKFSIAGSLKQDYTSAKNLFNSLGIEYYSILRRQKNSKNTGSCIMSSDKIDCLKFLNYIYQGDNYPCLGRKYLLYLEIKDHIEYVTNNPYFYAFKFKSSGKEKYIQDKIA